MPCCIHTARLALNPYFFYGSCVQPSTSAIVSLQFAHAAIQSEFKARTNSRCASMFKMQCAAIQCGLRWGRDVQRGEQLIRLRLRMRRDRKGQALARIRGRSERSEVGMACRSSERTPFPSLCDRLLRHFFLFDDELSFLVLLRFFKRLLIWTKRQHNKKRQRTEKRMSTGGQATGRQREIAMRRFCW